MKIIGVTGSIGMGKSSVAAMFQRPGVEVCSSDAFVHALMRAGGAGVAPVLAAFPGVEDAEGGIDRKKLGAIVFADKPKMKLLESILHPLVVSAQAEFAAAAQARGAKLVVIEIPLLYETGAEKRLDAVVVASAPPETQRQRVLTRPGMTEEKFASILASQMQDEEKRRRADYIVQTGCSLEDSKHHVNAIIDALARSHDTRNRT